MTHDEMIAVIQAAKEGKELQSKFRLMRGGEPNEWRELHRRSEHFDFADYDYRVNPEPPKPREFWIRRACSPINDIIVEQKPILKDFIHVREVIEPGSGETR